MIGKTSEFYAKIFSLKGKYNDTSSYRKTIASTRVFVAKNYPKSSQAMSSLFEDKSTNPTIDEPERPSAPDRTDHILVPVHLDERKRAFNKTEDLTNAMFAFFEVLYGQCSPDLQGKLKGFYGLDLRREEGDCAWLLLQVRQIVLDSHELPIQALLFTAPK